MKSSRVLLLALAASLPLAAQPYGTTFNVSPQIPIVDFQAMAALSDTGYVVIWTGPDGDGNGVFGQRFDLSGATLGSSFRVNGYTTGSQSHPAVAANAFGDFVVTWSGAGSGVDQAVFGQRYQSTGAALGGAFRVNESTTTGSSSSVALDLNGHFIVAWEAFTPASGFFQIFARRYDVDGTSIDANPFRVNADTSFSNYGPKVAASPAGFVVVWGTSLAAGADILGQRYDPNETALGANFRVNPATGGHHTSPSVTSRSDGSFVVAWDAVDGDGTGNGFGVRARRYDSAGAPHGTGFQVNSYTTGDQRFPTVVFDPVGNFLVVWQSDGQAPDVHGVYGRLIRESGAALTGEFRVNTAIARYPSAAASGSEGRFLVAWYGADREVARRVAIKGDANGDGTIDVSDIFYLINRLFAGGPALIGVGDVNADGTLDVADVFYLINYLFAGGPQPV